MLFINCNKDKESYEDSDVSDEDSDVSDEDSDDASDEEADEVFHEKVRNGLNGIIESEAVKDDSNSIDNDSDPDENELEPEEIEPPRATMEKIDENEITIFLDHTLPPIPQSWSRCRYYIHINKYISYTYQ